MVAVAAAFAISVPFDCAAQSGRRPVKRQHNVSEIPVDTIGQAAEVIAWEEYTDSVLEPVKPPSPYDFWEPTETTFNPDPNRAVWMAASARSTTADTGNCPSSSVHTSVWATPRRGTIRC